MRSVLPVLTYFTFKGFCEYLDDLVAHIDAPRLESLFITFFSAIILDTPQLVQFISRAPRLKAPKRARVQFLGDIKALVTIFSPTSGQTSFISGQPETGHGRIRMSILCRKSDWQVRSLEQVFTSCLPPLFTLENLSIESDPRWNPVIIENTQWLGLLQPFITVKNIFISRECIARIALALQELVGGGRTEVLPNLQNVFLGAPLMSRLVPPEGIRQFVATRQGSHSISVSRWHNN